ncbi:hypothetical protein TREES_T100002557 [Tupaia chinensis]|uniref:Uncharacterized protein n=1 Tax=Tupaia chinensis TaxID=246437 RepID=L9L940_TUPCH|nr:hypothetical protein TREES_T100002557 [Tupaia chinensis]
MDVCFFISHLWLLISSDTKLLMLSSGSGMEELLKSTAFHRVLVFSRTMHNQFTRNQAQPSVNTFASPLREGLSAGQNRMEDRARPRARKVLPDIWKRMFASSACLPRSRRYPRRKWKTRGEHRPCSTSAVMTERAAGTPVRRYHAQGEQVQFAKVYRLDFNVDVGYANSDTTGDRGETFPCNGHAAWNSAETLSLLLPEAPSVPAHADVRTLQESVTTTPGTVSS